MPVGFRLSDASVGARKGAVQSFTELTSPFRFNVFETQDVAAEFAISYGERMLIGRDQGTTMLNARELLIEICCRGLGDRHYHCL